MKRQFWKTTGKVVKFLFEFRTNRGRIGSHSQNWIYSCILTKVKSSVCFPNLVRSAFSASEYYNWRDVVTCVSFQGIQGIQCGRKKVNWKKLVQKLSSHAQVRKQKKCERINEFVLATIHSQWIPFEMNAEELETRKIVSPKMVSLLLTLHRKRQMF